MTTQAKDACQCRSWVRTEAGKQQNKLHSHHAAYQLRFQLRFAHRIGKCPRIQVMVYTQSSPLHHLLVADGGVLAGALSDLLLELLHHGLGLCEWDGVSGKNSEMKVSAIVLVTYS